MFQIKVSLRSDYMAVELLIELIASLIMKRMCVISCHYELSSVCALCRGADRVERGSNNCDDSQTLAIQQPRCREDEGDVRKHVDHGQPVDGHLLSWRVSGQRFVVVAMDDVEDDVQVDPLVSVAGGKSGEQKHHDPAPLKHAYCD